MSSPALRSLFLLAVMVACAHHPASAQTLQDQVLLQKGLAPQPAAGEWSVTLGGGIGSGPRFEGASTDRTHFDPLLEILYGRTLSFGINGLAWNAINDDDFRAGPVLGFEGGRRDNSDPHLYGLGDIHTSLTGGVFANYRIGPFDFGATVRQSLTHSSNGLTGLAHLDYLIRMPLRRTFIALGPDFELADSQYNQTWFGVTPTQSLDSGLPVFTPRGGVKDVGLHGSLTHYFSQHVLIHMLVSFKDIVGDAANSPIVEDRHQADFGAGLAYHF